MSFSEDDSIVSGNRMVPEPQFTCQADGCTIKLQHIGFCTEHKPKAAPKPRDRWSGFTDAERDAVEVALRLYIQARNPKKRRKYKGSVVGPGSEAITWGHAVDVLATIEKIKKVI